MTRGLPTAEHIGKDRGGGEWDAGCHGFWGTLSEVLAFDGPIGAAAAAAVERYLMKKWGLSAASGCPARRGRGGAGCGDSPSQALPSITPARRRAAESWLVAEKRRTLTAAMMVTSLAADQGGA